jgi:MarR family transcriptional regulator, lower aerobic nicotinate degradation pathway regulator
VANDTSRSLVASTIRVGSLSVDEIAPGALRGLASWQVAQVALIAERLVTAALGGWRRHHYRVLVALAEVGEASQAEIGRHVWLDRSDLHAAVSELEAARLVRRVRDEEDRRRTVVSLTPAGQAELARLHAAVAAAQAELLEPLSERDRATLARLLTRLIHHHAP